MWSSSDQFCAMSTIQTYYVNNLIALIVCDYWIPTMQVLDSLSKFILSWLYLKGTTILIIFNLKTKVASTHIAHTISPPSVNARKKRPFTSKQVRAREHEIPLLCFAHPAPSTPPEATVLNCEGKVAMSMLWSQQSWSYIKWLWQLAREVYDDVDRDR